MPRAQTAPTSRATKKRPTRHVKPYDRSSPVSGSDDLQEMQGDGGSESDVDVKTVKPTKAKTKAKSEYDKLHLVSLIVKSSEPNWDKVSSSTKKTPTRKIPPPKMLTRECRDTWRKTTCPLLLDNKPWSTAGPGWDQGMKVSAVMEVVSTSKPDWAVLGNIMDGKTATQVKDVWRKVILPRLKKGMTIQ